MRRTPVGSSHFGEQTFVEIEEHQYRATRFTEVTLLGLAPNRLCALPANVVSSRQAHRVLGMSAAEGGRQYAQEDQKARRAENCSSPARP